MCTCVRIDSVTDDSSHDAAQSSNSGSTKARLQLLIAGGCGFIDYFRPHRMHNMRTIATDDPVARRVILSVMRVSCAKTAERIDVLLGTQTPVSQRNIVLDLVQYRI